MATLVLGDSSSSPFSTDFFSPTQLGGNLFSDITTPELLPGLSVLEGLNATKDVTKESASDSPPHPRSISAEVAQDLRNGKMVLNDALSQDIPTEVTQHMQSLLVQAGYLRSNQASGTYDSTTAAAVRRFQGDMGINQDGIIGVFTANLLFKAAGRSEGMTEEQFVEFIENPQNSRFITPGFGRSSISREEVEQLYKSAQQHWQQVQSTSDDTTTSAQPERENSAELLAQVQTDPNRLTDRIINSSRVFGTVETLTALDQLAVQAGFDGIRLQPSQISENGGHYRMSRVAMPFEQVFAESNHWYMENWGWSPIIGHRDPQRKSEEMTSWLEQNAPNYGFAAIRNGSDVELVYLGKERAITVAQARRSRSS